MGPSDHPRHVYMENIVKERLKNLKSCNDKGDSRWVYFNYPKVNPKSGKVEESTALRFSKSELDNALEQTSKILQGVRINEPTTFGGKFHKPKNDTTAHLYRSIVTSTPPDVTKSTRIVAVCGIRPNMGAPSLDGWFLADFMLFYALLANLSPHQKWLHCVNLPELIQKYGSYVHGNPYQTRKEVLNQKIYDDAMKSNRPLKWIQDKYNDLHAEFNRQVSLEADEARKNNQPLLILFFGHGNDMGKIWLGDKCMGIPTLKRYLGLATQSSKSNKLQVTFVSTACYSGGWLARANLGFNITGQASSDASSLSWRRSASSGQLPGSIVSSALAQTLVLKAGTERPLDPDDENFELPQGASETYAALTHAVHNVLLSRVDRYAALYGAVSFSAQDDLWEMTWGKRTGISLWGFKANWDKLEDFEPDKWLHQGDWLNNDPNVPQEKRDEYLDFVRSYETYMSKFPGAEASKGGQVDPTQSLGSRSGNKRTARMMQIAGIEAVRSHIERLIELYNTGKPGHPDAAKNHEICRQMERFSDGFGDETFLNDLLENLEYRLDVIDKADEYVDMLGLARSNGITCSDWDETEFINDPRDQKRWQQIGNLISSVSKILFPIPVGKSGDNEYAKGRLFVKEALYHSAWSQAVIEKNVHNLVQIVLDETKEIREVIKRDPEVREKRRKVKEVFGSIMRDISPERPPPRQGPSEKTTYSSSRRGSLSPMGQGNPVIYPALGLSTSSDSPSKRSPGTTATDNPRLGQSPQRFSSGGSPSNQGRSYMSGQYGPPPAFDPRQQQHQRRPSNLKYQSTGNDPFEAGASGSQVPSGTRHPQQYGYPPGQSSPGTPRPSPGSGGSRKHYEAPSQPSPQFGVGSRQSSTSHHSQNSPQGNPRQGFSSGDRSGSIGNRGEGGNSSGQGRGVFRGSPSRGGNRDVRGRGGYQEGREQDF